MILINYTYYTHSISESQELLLTIFRNIILFEYYSMLITQVIKAISNIHGHAIHHDCPAAHAYDLGYDFIYTHIYRYKASLLTTPWGGDTPGGVVICEYGPAIA